jgi:hypothetical protein
MLNKDKARLGSVKASQVNTAVTRDAAERRQMSGRIFVEEVGKK